VSLFFESPPRVVVQGITGREARMVVAHTLTYGTDVAAGVTPGRGGDAVEGVPVFDTIDDATATRGPFDASLVSVPPLATLDAVAEAVAAEIGLIVVATENVPRHDAMRLLALARDAGATVVGPNSVGVLEPGIRVKLGAIGGQRPARAFAPGRVGVVSRSGGLAAEVGLQLQRSGIGVSTALSIGGDALIGMTPAETIRRFADDPETDAVIYVGEPGTSLEERLADTLEELPAAKPLVALVLGRFVTDFPRGMVFGHAAAVVEGKRGDPAAKVRRLEEAGALVAESLDAAVRLVEQAIGREPVL
jgi:succinyl-CoA synthetase alpha subunit